MERKKLIEYQSPFMRRFSEIKEIMETEDIEAELAEEAIQRVLDSAFILDCDIYAIRKYEAMLGILPDAGDTLEARKSRVLIRWNDTIPYTWKTFMKKLNLLCEGNYEVKNNFKSGYTVYLTAHLGLPGQVVELGYLLGKILPANLVVEAENVVEFHSSGYGVQAAAGAVVWNYEIS